MATDSAESLARRSVTINPAVLNKRLHGTLLPGMANRCRANAAKDGHFVTAAFQNTSGSVAAVAYCNVGCHYLLFNGRTMWLPAGVIFSKERDKVGLPTCPFSNWLSCRLFRRRLPGRCTCPPRLISLA